RVVAHSSALCCAKYAGRLPAGNRTAGCRSPMRRTMMTTTASIELTLKDISKTGSKDDMCSTQLLDAPWDVDVRPGYGPGASLPDTIPAEAPRQGEIPEEYKQASAEELDARIRAAKETLGDRVV